MLSLPSARTVLTSETGAGSVWLSGRKVLGTNLNCSESCLGIRWWEIAALRDLGPANVRFGLKSGQVQNEQLSALPPKADVRSYGASSRTNGHGNAYAVERAADPLHRAREPSDTSRAARARAVR
jgi:hypothetical protein